MNCLGEKYIFSFKSRVPEARQLREICIKKRKSKYVFAEMTMNSTKTWDIYLKRWTLLTRNISAFPCRHACLRLLALSSVNKCQLLWSRALKSSSSAMANKYWVSFTSSWSLSLFAWAFLKGLIVKPFCGFITKFLLRSSNIIVFFEL